MSTLLILFLLIAGIGILAYLRASLVVATVVFAVGLFVLNKITSGFGSNLLMAVAWVTWIGVALMNFRQFRFRFLSRPALTFFRGALPTISQTEQDALDAGTVWWDAELFSGDPHWKRLLDLPAENLTPVEQKFLDGPVDELCEMLDEWQISREHGDLPASVWQFLKDEGFLGMIIPSEYGGKGFSARAHSRVIGKIASRSGTAAVSVMVPNSLGPAELLLRYGTTAQKDHYLPRLAIGEEVPCFALTNPFAGSDAAAIPASAARSSSATISSSLREAFNTSSSGDLELIPRAWAASRARGVICSRARLSVIEDLDLATASAISS